MKPFKIKICGITTVGDAMLAREFGADAIGLNFYHKSLRSVDLERAREISAAVGKSISKIGVFVNSNINHILELVQSVELDAIQLHGDESPEIMSELTGFPVIRAVRNFTDIEAATVQIDSWIKAGVAGILLDASAPGQFGGTGHKLDWEAVAEVKFTLPLILAGGLTVENVGDAIRTANPDAVDVASGIEGFPGSKNKVQMQQFIKNAKAAFAQKK